jgi:hypothetical protein
MSLWLCRAPYIAGRCIHTQLRRINNIVGLIADLKVIHALEVINDEIHNRELGMFTRD